MDLFFFIIGLFAIVLLSVWFGGPSTEKRKKSQLQIIRNLAKKHQQVLAKKRAQLLVEDDYGDLDDKKWFAEVQRFFTEKVEPDLEEVWHERADANISGEEAFDTIDDVAREFQDSKPDLFQFDESMDGIEYEHYCADILRRSGWDASVSKASNDQGVDIVASNQRLSVAIQCKKYSSPVGNKAVQEVTSGATFHNTEYAVVVSNSSYTTSARQLAAKSSVLLLHHSELGRLEEMLDRQ